MEKKIPAKELTAPLPKASALYSDQNRQKGGLNGPDLRRNGPSLRKKAYLRHTLMK